MLDTTCDTMVGECREGTGCCVWNLTDGFHPAVCLQTCDTDADCRPGWICGLPCVAGGPNLCQVSTDGWSASYYACSE